MIGLYKCTVCFQILWLRYFFMELISLSTHLLDTHHFPHIFRVCSKIIYNHARRRGKQTMCWIKYRSKYPIESSTEVSIVCIERIMNVLLKTPLFPYRPYEQIAMDDKTAMWYINVKTWGNILEYRLRSW